MHLLLKGGSEVRESEGRGTHSRCPTLTVKVGRKQAVSIVTPRLQLLLIVFEKKNNMKEASKCL